MLPTDLIHDPSDYAVIRARLARPFLEHKADLGVPVVNDAEIVRRVDEITASLWGQSGMALRRVTCIGYGATTGSPRWLTDCWACGPGSGSTAKGG